MEEVPGLYRTRFEKVSDQSLRPALVGNCRFIDQPGLPLTRGKDYPVHLVSPTFMPTLIKQLRGRETQQSLANRSGINQKTLSTFESGLTEMEYAPLQRVYQALGGEALYLAFFPNALSGAAQLPLLTVSLPRYAQRVGAYFKQERLLQQLRQEDIARRLRVKQNRVSRFEKGDCDQRATNIEHTFNALDIAVAYLGIQPAAA